MGSWVGWEGGAWYNMVWYGVVWYGMVCRYYGSGVRGKSTMAALIDLAE